MRTNSAELKSVLRQPLQGGEDVKWDIIGPTPFSGLRGVHPVICLTATEMKKIVLVTRTAGSDEVAVDD